MATKILLLTELRTGASQISFSKIRQTLLSIAMKTLLLILCLFLARINSQGQSTNSGNGVNLDTNKPIARVSVGSDVAERQVTVLQAQLDLMKQYDSRLLATVYWALAGTFVMWGLINGFAWYANLRIYRSDKESLMQEIRDRITTETRTLEKTLSTNLSSSTATLGQLVDSKSKAISENLSQTITQLDQKLDATTASVKRNLKNLDYKFSEIEASAWLAQGLGVNALRNYNTMLQTSIEHSDHFTLARNLAAIQTTLKTIIEKTQLKPDALLIRELNQTFAKTPVEYQQTLNAIRNLIEALAA